MMDFDIEDVTDLGELATLFETPRFEKDKRVSGNMQRRRHAYYKKTNNPMGWYREGHVGFWIDNIKVNNRSIKGMLVVEWQGKIVVNTIDDKKKNLPHIKQFVTVCSEEAERQFEKATGKEAGYEF